MQQSGGGTLTIKVVEGKLTRDTETFGYIDSFKTFLVKWIPSLSLNIMETNTRPELTRVVARLLTGIM